jgi:hypothetical protein
MHAFYIPATLLFGLILGCNRDNAVEPAHSTPKWKPATEQVNGAITTLESMRVLTLHGTFYEMGYAHGYLLAPEILERQELELSQPGVIDFFENQVLPNIHLFDIPDQYMEEIDGMYAGFLSRGGGSVYSELLQREVTLTDAIALNCINALASRVACSSFSAWNHMTYDNNTITGYNHDTKDDERNTERWLLIVRNPLSGSGANSSVCAGRAGDMNVHTVINDMGVTLSCQSINDASPATSTEGFTPEGLIFRQLIESVDYIDPAGDISGVLDDIYATEAEALLMSWPASAEQYSAIALELDGDLLDNHGYTIRQPSGAEEYIIQTNHFWLRRQPVSQCDRYYYVKSSLDSIAAGTRSPLTVESAWNLLSNIQPEDSYLTQIAVVFEPSKMRMHIAFAEPGKHAHLCRREILNIEALLSD